MTALFEQKAPGIMSLLMQDFPLTVEDAAAPLGNIGEECGGFELLQEQSPIGGGAGGFGWAQWTGPRRVQFLTYCSRANLDPKSDKANYGFLFVELKGAYAHVLDKVRAAVGVAAKVVAFMNGYEMPNAAYAHVDVRTAYANRAIAAYNVAPKPIPPLFAPGTPPPAPPVSIPVAAGSTQGSSTMAFNIGSVISLITQAPSIIEGVMTLVNEIEAGYNQGKASGDPIVIFEDILAQLIANKGAVASAVLGPEPIVTKAGAVVPATKK